LDWGFEKEELRVGTDIGRPDEVRDEGGWREGIRGEVEAQGEEVEEEFPRKLEGMVYCCDGELGKF
jgi:hypothetical protein